MLRPIVLEMFLRIFIISYLIGRIGFEATAFAEIGAWVGALAVNIYAFYTAMAPLIKKPGSHQPNHINVTKIPGLG